MNEYWHAFYVSDYKGGELYSLINVDVDKILDFIVYDWEITDAFDEVENLEALTDDDLYDMYCSNISNNTYAFDDRSAPKIYTTSESGRLTENFPPKEAIVKYMYERLKSYKEWKQEK